MIREILFRGKRADNGEWVEGSLVSDSDEFGEILKCFGCESTDDTPDGYYYAQYEVDMSTVGKYTGLKDRNGRRIFEGDIIKTKYGRLCTVVWFSSNCFAGWDLNPILTRENLKNNYPSEYDLFLPENLEVIGNVHDNPELLKGE